MLGRQSLRSLSIAAIMGLSFIAFGNNTVRTVRAQMHVPKPADAHPSAADSAKSNEPSTAPASSDSATTKPTSDVGAGTVRQGEISANDVYVRSGDSMNHYTICKLNSGDKVTVVGERGDWYEIKPPDGTFSLVSGDYVDTTDDKTGTINGNNVRVRAGSTLNDNKYTVQTLLSKGTPVEILGRNPDGFLKIKPPEGATLWVNKSFVSVGGTGAIARKAEPSARGTSPSTSAAPIASSESGARTPTSVRTEKSERTTSGSLSSMTGEWRSKLDELDALARAELQKPASEQNFSPLISRFQSIADQAEDDFSRQFAQRRIDEMNNMIALSGAIKKARELDDMSETQRREYLAARAKIPEPTVPVPEGLEVRGELRESAVYKPGSSNTRYRLVDTRSGTERTAAYVEVPSDVNVNISDLLGHQVVVRASEIRPHNGAVEPIPIYVARDIALSSE